MERLGFPSNLLPCGHFVVESNTTSLKFCNDSGIVDRIAASRSDSDIAIPDFRAKPSFKLCNRDPVQNQESRQKTAVGQSYLY